MTHTCGYCTGESLIRNDWGAFCQGCGTSYHLDVEYAAPLLQYLTPLYPPAPYTQP